MIELPFQLPPLTVHGISPLWEGKQFRIGDEIANVLNYSSNKAGWSDDLTAFHEETSGEQHFIDRASRDYAIQQLKKYVQLKKPTLLEVGCSSGFMLQRIHSAFPGANIIGSDVVDQPLLKLSKQVPHIPLLRFDLLHCPLPDKSVDAVIMLNVLEHIKEDGAALKQVYRILKPGGVLVIEVPAGPQLYDIYDKMLMHYRRYKLSGLRSLVKEQGFNIVKQSHLGFFLYPGFWWIKQRNKWFLTKPESVQNQLVEKNIRDTGDNKLFHAIMQTELFLGKRISYPVGIRCLMTCAK